MLIFAFPEGFKIHTFSSSKLIKIHCEDYIQKRYQNDTKMTSKPCKNDPKHNNTEKQKLQKVSNKHHSVSQSASQSASQSVSLSVSQPVNQSVSQSASQPVSQSASQSVSQPASQSTHPSTDHFVRARWREGRRQVDSLP